MLANSSALRQLDPVRPVPARLEHDKRLQFIVGRPSCVYWKGERIASKSTADILIHLICHEGQSITPSFFVTRLGLSAGTISVLVARLRRRLHELGVGFNVSHNDSHEGWRLMRFE
jgi:hypothetical protein